MMNTSYEFAHIGKSGKAYFADEIVTGKALYAGDIPAEGVLVGKALYARKAHARIINIDVTKARNLPGVICVLTSKDVPGKNSYLYEDCDQPVIVDSLIRFQGDVLALVAAQTEEIAEAAVKAITFETELLPVVNDPIAALSSDSASMIPGKSNIYKSLEINHGDIEAGFKQADFIIENEYSTPMHEHAFLEKEATLVVPEGNKLTVYSSTQYPYSDKRQIARFLGLDESQVRVIVPHVGGAFGGKDEAHVQLHAALLSWKTKMPVRMVRTREESILVHVKRHPFIIQYKTGVKRTGKITAIDVNMVADTGAYANSGGTVIVLAANCVGGPYDIPNARVKGTAVFSNNPPCGAMRGFGMPQAIFACERQMDEVAKCIGLDPIKVRDINAVQDGDILVNGVKLIADPGMSASLKKTNRYIISKKRDYVSRREKPYLKRGWGIASALVTFLYPRGSDDASEIHLTLDKNGCLTIVSSATDMGQGTYTVLLRLGAEAVGIKEKDVILERPDTEIAPDSGSSVASRQTFVSGNALLAAAKEINDKLFEVVESEFGIARDTSYFKNGNLFINDKGTDILLRDVAREAAKESGVVTGNGHYKVNFSGNIFSKNAFQFATGGLTFATQTAQVLVDTETGLVKVEDLNIIIDAGKVIHMDGALGQIRGGISMGLGQTLMEKLVVEQGITKNLSLSTYLIPTSMDIPNINVNFLEIPHPDGPFGAKGIGEASILATTPAIVNAISNAIGHPINSIPATPEVVYNTIHK